MAKGGIKAKFVESVAPTPPQQVTIKVAKNGFVISCGYGDDESIAQDLDKALAIAKEKLGSKAKEDSEESEDMEDEE